eukprot:GHRQ01032522.1.p1 GENE.GHRQ01032522.1~~GHRQ01032522.1.p1  ORF type:complete len:171 (+),score=29.00 GHRQ01032522.1:374-886(+)
MGISLADANNCQHCCRHSACLLPYVLQRWQSVFWRPAAGLVEGSQSLPTTVRGCSNKAFRCLCFCLRPQVLNAYSNQLRALPQDFGSLCSLTRLGLKGNQLAELPRSFTQLTNLVELFLTDNRLTTLPEGEPDDVHSASYLGGGVSLHTCNGHPGLACHVVNAQALYQCN